METQLKDLPKNQFTEYENGLEMLKKALFFNGETSYTTEKRLLDAGFSKYFTQRNIIFANQWSYKKPQKVVRLDAPVDLSFCIGYTDFYILPDKIETDEQFEIVRDKVSAKNDCNIEMEGRRVGHSKIFGKSIYNEYDRYAKELSN